MYIINYFEKLYLILMMTFHTFNGESLKVDPEDGSICGLSKKQIQKALSYSKKSIKGIAIDAKCLEERNNSNEYLAEQYKLIECLQKEYLLAKDQVNEIIEENEVAEKFDDQDIQKYNLQNIAEGNEKLDKVAKDYEETIIKHLESIDDMIAKRICVDELTIALTNTKIELIATICKDISNNINKICKLGVYSQECALI